MALQTVHDFAAEVRGRRRDLGINQAELAARAGVSRKWIYEFEAGKPTAELGLLLKVLDALGVTLSTSTRSAAPGGVDLDELLREHRADG